MTFRDLNPDVTHHVFTEASADEFIAANFTSRELAAFRACAVPAMQADYFRYCAVLTLGGIYADVDFCCAVPLQPLAHATSDGLLFQNAKGDIINAFFVFDAPNHPLLRLAVDVATENISLRAADKVHMVTGPWIFTILNRLSPVGAEGGRSTNLRRQGKIGVDQIGLPGGR